MNYLFVKNIKSNTQHLILLVRDNQGRKEMFYLMTRSTHFITVSWAIKMLFNAFRIKVCYFEPCNQLLVANIVTSLSGDADLFKCKQMSCSHEK